MRTVIMHLCLSVLFATWAPAPTAAQSTHFVGVEIPHHVRIQAPAADVGPEIARFVGIWGGEWQGIGLTFREVIAVERVNAAGDAVIVRVVGADPGGLSDGAHQRHDVTIVNGRFSYKTGWSSITLRMGDDGSLRGSVERQGYGLDIRMAKAGPDAAPPPGGGEPFPDLDVPAGVITQPPPPGIAADIAAFAGTWGGYWDDDLPCIFVVSSVNGFGVGEGVLIWGDARKGPTRKGRTHAAFKIANGVLSMRLGKAGFEFRLLATGELRGEIRVPSGYVGVVNMIRAVTSAGAGDVRYAGIR